MYYPGSHTESINERLIVHMFFHCGTLTPLTNGKENMLLLQLKSDFSVRQLH